MIVIYTKKWIKLYLFLDPYLNYDDKNFIYHRDELQITPPNI